MVDVDLLVPHPLNPNKHGERQIEMLAKIMNHQGWRHPITVSKRSGFIVAGHGRLMAAKKLGWTQAPVDRQEFDTEADEYAHLIADNKIAELAEHDDLKMFDDLKKFPDLDLDLLGIPDFELPMPEIVPGCDADDVPEALPEPKVVRGEVYILGNHRLMCGDSTMIDDVERLMNGEKADMVFTDPPYGMRLDTDYRSMGSKNNFKPILGDGDDFKPELIQTLLGAFSYCSEIFLFGADYYAELINNRNDGSWIVWDKRSHGEENIGTLDGSFGSDFELCWSKAKHQRKMCRVIRNKGAFIKKREGVGTVHPSQKPVEMVEWFFDKWAKNLKNIADLFGGSGSTLIACEKTNRKCFMMELDPHYCGVILDRWQKFTGKKAHREDGVAWDEIRQ
jgi:DNA modification methylase